MPTFISLFSWTEPGVHDVKNTAKRAADFRSSIQDGGGSVKDIYWTMGRHDGVIIFEAPHHHGSCRDDGGMCERECSHRNATSLY